MFLATTANQQYWKKDEKILFLGEWCKLYSQKHVWQNLQHDTLPFHWENREKFHQDYLYCESLYEKVLIQLGEQLNQIHSVNHSPRYWRIFVGPWLFTFISLLYERYLTVQAAASSGLVSNTWLPSIKSGQWVGADFSVFYDWFQCNDNFNLYVFGNIIQKFGLLPFEIKDDPSLIQNLKHISVLQPESNIKEAIKKLIIFYSKKIPDHLNKIVFANSYLGRADLIQLQLSLGQMPYPVTPNVSFGRSDPDFNIRQNLRLSSLGSDFESLLGDMILELIPTCYVEDYTALNQKSLKAFPKSPKVIFTTCCILNESLKLWAALHAEEGTKLVVSQHGGGYGVCRWAYNESHETKISDRYFTWGWDKVDVSNIAPMSSGKLNYFRGKIKPDPNGSILWVAFSMPRYPRIYSSDVLGPEMPSYFHDQECFLRSVSKEVYKHLYLRLYIFNYGWDEAERWKDIDPALKRYPENQPFQKQISKSRLCVITYNSTTFLETFAADFPTILFWDPQKGDVRESAQPYFDDLRRVGILHDTPESAAAKVNEIFEDPISWWASSEIQKVKDKFCNKFARTSDNWLSQWKQELLKIANDYRG